jgi:hypothetical protein
MDAVSCVSVTAGRRDGQVGSSWKLPRSGLVASPVSSCFLIDTFQKLYFILEDVCGNLSNSQRT